MAVSRFLRREEGSPQGHGIASWTRLEERSERSRTSTASLQFTGKSALRLFSRRQLIRLSLLAPLAQLDCSRRTAAVLLETGSYDTAGWAHDVALDSGRIYVSDRQGGFLVYQQSDLHRPPAIMTPVKDVISLAPRGGSPLLAARFEGLVLVSAAGRVAAIYSNGDIANTVVTRDNLAFAAYGKHGLVVARLENEGIRAIAELSTPGWSHDVKLWEDRALLADWDYGLRVVDIGNPEKPVEISTLPTPATAISIAIDRGRRIVAVAEGHGGVALAQLNADGSPKLLSRHPLGLNPGDPPHPEKGGWAHSVAWGGRHLFVANWKRGIAVLDARDPGNPRLLLEHPTDGTALGVAVEPAAGGTWDVFLADGEAGLRTFRFSAP